MSEEQLPEGYEKYPVKSQDITLYTSHVEVKMPNGMVKAISLGDFISTLSKTVKQENTLNAILLPANCYTYGQSLTELKLACYYPGRLRKIKFYRKHSDSTTIDYVIPFPNIIISHSLKKRADTWEHQDARYFATSKTIGQLDRTFIWVENQLNQIWTLPFANIYTEGRLCQGQNSLPKIFKDQYNLRGLDWHFAVLYNSSFNEDLLVPSLPRSKKAEAWYKEISEYQAFPYELLKNGDKVKIITQSMAQEVMSDVQTGAMDVPTAPQPVPRVVPVTPAPFTEQVTTAALDTLLAEVGTIREL